MAVVRFAISGSIDWYHGSLAMLGVVTGGYLAAKLAHHIPAAWIRMAVLIYGAGLTAYFFWRTYSI